MKFAEPFPTRCCFNLLLTPPGVKKCIWLINSIATSLVKATDRGCRNKRLANINLLTGHFLTLGCSLAQQFERDRCGQSLRHASRSSLWVRLTVQSRKFPAERTVERSVSAVSNKDTRIGVYLNVLPDCTSGPLPTIRLVSPPTAGKVMVRTAKAKATNYKACLALEVPAYVAFYKSPPEFLGDDVLTIEIKYAGGRTEIQKITVKVSGPGGQRNI